MAYSIEVLWTPKQMAFSARRHRSARTQERAGHTQWPSAFWTGVLFTVRRITLVYLETRARCDAEV